MPPTMPSRHWVRLKNSMRPRRNIFLHGAIAPCDVAVKYVWWFVVCVLFLCGCTPGKLSVKEGDVRFAIPFELSKPQQHGEDLREESNTEELEHIEKARAHHD